MAEYRSGFISVVGRPNVGKSTLINSLLGEKIVIASSKPQTTRRKIRAILTTPEAQMIFYDTPGLHKPLHRLGEEMNKAAINTLSMVDVILWVTDAAQPAGRGDLWVVERLREYEKKILVAINKIDLNPRFDTEDFFRRIGIAGWPSIKVSALTGVGIRQLQNVLTGLLPPGPKFFPDEMVTDQPEAFIVSDLIREGIINHTEEEVPHSVAVNIEEIKKRSNQKLYVRATVYVDRDTQKKIIIGKAGERLRKIGTVARRAIEDYFHNPVYLDLWVKTRRDWRDSFSDLKELGYLHDSEDR